MAKLKVLENKKLVLKNVLKKKLRNMKIENINNEIQKFGNTLNLLKVQTFGPLVIKACGVNIGDDGALTANYDLLIQAHDYMQYKDKFVTEERHECKKCAYIHFEGSPEELNYAHTKLDLYFYENDLESNGEVYTVLVEETKDYTVVDLFKPVLQL